MVYLETSLEIHSILLTPKMDIEVRDCSSRYSCVVRSTCRAVAACSLPSLPGWVAVDLDGGCRGYACCRL